MRCEQIGPKITSYLLGDLSEADAALVRDHIESCEACRALARETEPTLDLLRDALAASSEAPAHLSAAHRARITRTSTGAGPIRLVIDWAMHGHPRLAVAAGLLLVAGFFWAAINAMTPARERVRRFDSVEEHGPAMPDGDEVSLIEMEPSEEGELETVKHNSYDMGLPMRTTGEVASEGAGAATESAFDSVTEFRSPVVMRGLYGSRGQSRGEVEDIEELEDLLAERPEPDVTYEAGRAGYALNLRLPDSREMSVEPEPPETEIREKALQEVAKPPEPAATHGDFVDDGVWLRARKKSAIQAAPAEEMAAKLTSQLQGNQPVDGLDTDGDEADTVRPAPTLDAEPVQKLRSPQVRPPAHGRRPRTEGMEGEAVPSREAPRTPSDSFAAGKIVDRMRDWQADRPENSGVNGMAGEPAAGVKVAEVRPSGGKYDEPTTPRPQKAAVDKKKSVARGTGEDNRLTQNEELPTEPRFRASAVNLFQAVAEEPLSTFSIDVDTASYTVARNYMSQGMRPPAEAVRTEEFVNFFDYAYKAPVHDIFKVYGEIAPSKFGRGLHLMKIGVKGKRLGREERRRAALTFLIDTSGSMDMPDRLGLLKKSLRMLIERLDPHDTISIVQYDSHARLLLEQTPASAKAHILKVIDNLQCSGSTNLGEGMERGYEMAERQFVSGGENRVLLLSDGVANLGTDTAEDILAKIERYRKQGIYCSVFGFGIGTYDDAMLETLANRGDGTYAFVDSEAEARRIFVDDLAATLNTIAADVKIQVEFNPKLVKRYRQLGYENRQLRKQDFRNPAVDAGEIGSGQSVTALYEVELEPEVRGQKSEVSGQKSEVSLSPGLRRDGKGEGADHVAIVRVRYRRTDTGKVEEIEEPVRVPERGQRFEDADVRFQLAAGVAEFAEIQRGSPYAAGSTLEDVAEVLRPVALELDLDGRVQELLRLVTTAPGVSREE